MARRTCFLRTRRPTGVYGVSKKYGFFFGGSAII